MSTYFPTMSICSRCGKPEHGSLACEYAPGWPEQPKVEFAATRLDPMAPGGPLDRIAGALERIAAQLGAQSQDTREDT